MTSDTHVPCKFSTTREGVTLFGKTTVCKTCSSAYTGTAVNRTVTHPTLNVPRNDHLSRGDAQRTRNLLHLGNLEGLLDELATAEGRIGFKEQSVFL